MRGSPSRGGASQCHLPMLGAVPGAAPGRDLGDPQLPARGWGERIDPGRNPGVPPPRSPSRQCPPEPGCSLGPAVRAPTLLGRCGAAIFPAHPIPPLPAQGSGRDAGDAASPRAPTPPLCRCPGGGYGASSPTPLATEPRLLDDAPPSSSSSARLPAPHPRWRAAPCRGGGRRGLQAQRWGWQRCHRLSARVPERGQQAGSRAAEPGGRQRCQAGIGVRMDARGAAPPSLFPVSSASLHPPPSPPSRLRSPSPSCCFPELQQLSAM